MFGLKSVFTCFAICTLLLFSSCEKRNYVQTSYLATQCSDPWGNGNQVELREKVKNYLSDQGIEIISMDFKQNRDVLVCQSCGCYSGLEILVTVLKDDVSKIQTHGFSVVEE